MLKGKILREIQMDIRKNFGKTVNWESLPKGKFNCFMYAVSNTIPTEVLYEEKDDEPPMLISLVNEPVAYFGNIGQISGNLNFRDTVGLIEALKADMKTLGILAEKCSPEDIVPNDCIKIVFLYDTSKLSNGTDANFHFLKCEGINHYTHKNGWTGDVESFVCTVDELEDEDLEIIGFFKLSLDHNREL